MTLGMFAVNFFFLISGYLIAKSWMRDPHAGNFMKKRIARIYPAYIFALVFSIAVGAMLSIPNSSAYWLSIYRQNERLLDGVLFLDSTIVNQPRVFPGDPRPAIINGPMWTLQFEMKCYLILLVLGLFQLLSRRSLILVLAAFSYFMFLLSAIDLRNAEFTFWRLLTYFLFGVCAANLDPVVFFRTIRNPCLALAALIALVATAKAPRYFFILLPLAGSYLVFAASFARANFGSEFFKRHDLSYGVYLYAFPLQQLFVFKLGIASPLQLFFYSAAATFCFGWLSWQLIESPCLARVRDT
jgi:peptidoglycan/LPS O-acetylase OafA/YrhL